ncbi:MAG: HAD family phosphatase [Deltaproteobacteria bacterium]|nr:HAD family phosphatase [Deltaproteobacteria bacterium]
MGRGPRAFFYTRIRALVASRASGPCVLRTRPTGSSAVAPFDVILFDLGGVVIELDGPPIRAAWTSEQDETEVWRRWIHSTAVRRFESGRGSSAEFCDEIVRELGLSIDGDEFLRHFLAWPKGIYPGMYELLRTLGETYRVGCLTNCNELHWRRYIDDLALGQVFHHPFSSHELGALKPDAEIFERVVRELGCPAERVLFVDDNQMNVDGAVAAGLHAFRAKGPEEVRAGLARAGVLRR